MGSEELDAVVKCAVHMADQRQSPFGVTEVAKRNARHLAANTIFPSQANARGRPCVRACLATFSRRKLVKNCARKRATLQLAT